MAAIALIGLLISVAQRQLCNAIVAVVNAASRRRRDYNQDVGGIT
jgi:hypothetical protein